MMMKSSGLNISVLLLTLCAISLGASGQVTFLGAGSGLTGSDSNFAEFTFTVPDGTALLVVGATDGVGDRAPQSATVGGVSMTLAVTGHYNGNTGGNENGTLFYLANPPASAQTIRVTWNGSLRCKTLGAVALGNVNTQNPVIATKVYWNSGGNEGGTVFSAAEAPIGSHIVSSCGGRFADGPFQFSTDVQVRGTGHIQVYAATAEDGWLAYWRHRGVMGRMPMTSAGTDQIRNWAEWNWGAAAMSVRPANGTLMVTINPAWARDVGGQWSVDGGTIWHDSGLALSLFPGQYTVQFRNLAGINTPGSQNVSISSNVSTSITGTYTDTIPPTGTISINAGDLYTDSLVVDLALSAADGGSGMANGQMRFSNNNTTWSGWEAYAASKLGYGLATGADGSRTVYVQYRDAAGVVSEGTLSDSIIVDRQPPVITVTSLISNSSTPVLTGTVSDTLSGVASVEISVGGQVIPASINGTTWSAPVTIPLADGTYDVAANAWDNAGNIGTDSSVDELVIDTQRPTCVIDTSNYPLGTTEEVPIVVTLAFSELVSPFTANDLIISNASSVNVSGAGTTYTISLWPAGIGDVTCLLPENTVFDAAGNGNEASNTAVVEFLSENPVCTVSGPVAFTSNPNIVFTIRFLPAVASLNMADILVANCTKQSLTFDGTAYLLTVTALEDGPVTCRVPAGVAYDANTQTLPNLASNMVVVIYDTTPPTVNVTLTGPTPTTEHVLPFRAVFSEDVGMNFSAADVSFTGTLAPLASLSGIARSGNTYTITAVLSNPNANGTLGIVVGPDIEDFAGNQMVEAASSPLYRVRNWFGFTTQPDSKRAYVGDSHVMSVSASFGEGAASYQWWKRTVNKAEAPVSGATTPTLLFANLQLADQGTYWCEVTYDGEVEASNEATLEVQPHLQIVTHPEGGEAFLGHPFTFTVAASGGYEPVNYQWKKNGAVIFDAPNAEEWTLENIDFSDEGSYTVVVSDGYLDVIESAPAVLVVSELTVPVSGLAALLASSALLAAVGALGIRRKRRS